jgi:hypothetical protein
VTTYSVPNPSSYQSSEVSYQSGSISSSSSALYFLVNVATGTATEAFVETAGTSGTVTNHTSLGYAIPYAGNAALTYASDGNVWVIAVPTETLLPQLITKVALPGGATTNYQAPACPSIPYPANLVQGGDGNLYIPAYNPGAQASRGICSITTAGVATFTPVSPFPQPIFDLTVATDGSVWYAVPKGVGRIYSGTITQYADPALHDVSQGVFALPNGTLWEIGTFPSAETVQVLNPSSP